MNLTAFSQSLINGPFWYPFKVCSFGSGPFWPWFTAEVESEQLQQVSLCVKCVLFYWNKLSQLNKHIYQDIQEILKCYKDDIFT